MPGRRRASSRKKARTRKAPAERAFDPSASASAEFNEARDGASRTGGEPVQRAVMTVAASVLVGGMALRLLRAVHSRFALPNPVDAVLQIEERYLRP